METEVTCFLPSSLSDRDWGHKSPPPLYETETESTSRLPPRSGRCMSELISLGIQSGYIGQQLDTLKALWVSAILMFSWVQVLSEGQNCGWINVSRTNGSP